MVDTNPPTTKKSKKDTLSLVSANPSERDRRRQDAVVLASAMAYVAKQHYSSSHRDTNDEPDTEDMEREGRGYHSSIASQETESHNDQTSPFGKSSEGLPPSPLVTPPGGKCITAIMEHPDEYSPQQSHSLQTGHEEAQSKDSANMDYSPSSSHSNNKGSASSKRGVPHIYHDYSQVPDVLGYVRKKTGGVTQPFPEKLHEMLHALEFDAAARQIVSWLPHGRAFLVHKPKEFTREIMPK